MTDKVPAISLSISREGMKTTISDFMLLAKEDGLRRTPILIGTHHKTGTVWMHDTFFRIGAATGRHLAAVGSRGEMPPADIHIAHHSQFTAQALHGEYRGLHLIRDPRDIVISGLHYHRWSDEAWLHFPRPNLNGLTYQQKLNSLGPDDQFVFELENAGLWTLEEMLIWDYKNPRFHEAKYEDLIVDREAKYFAQILSFLGFNDDEVARGKAVFCQNSIFAKPRSMGTGHIRSGKPAQWSEHYRRWHGQRFVAAFGNCLVRLGYETDNSWVDALPA